MKNDHYYREGDAAAAGCGPMLALIFGGGLLCFVLGIGVGGAIPSPKPAIDERSCIVIDLRTKPGAGKIIPAEPGI